MSMPAEALREAIASQVRTLLEIAQHRGVSVRHVKPHGALYNVAAVNTGIAATIAEALVEWRERLVLVGLAGSAALAVWQDRGFKVVAEAFADRRYEADGSLRARVHPDALIIDPTEAARQAVRIVADRCVLSNTGTAVYLEAQTLCVHGDTPNAPAIVISVRDALDKLGLQIRSIAMG